MVPQAAWEAGQPGSHSNFQSARVSMGEEEPASCATTSVPVMVMLPLDTVNADGVFRYASSKWFLPAIRQLAATGIHGVAVDVWWGAVERSPRRYDWSGYRQLFSAIKPLGLKFQVVMSFHACGGNVGDNALVPLPPWVHKVGDSDPDIFFTDRPRESSPGQRNREYISWFAETEPGLLRGRSVMECYIDFMRAFRDEFMGELGSLIEEVVVGSGPCGELRYPAYPETNGWRFPGIGEFQCYDRRALASLARAAGAAGHPEWGNSGPSNAGSYNSHPEETGFFQTWNGGWQSPQGEFFLGWYSDALLEHGERMLTAVTSVFNSPGGSSSGDPSPRSSDTMVGSPHTSVGVGGTPPPANGTPDGMMAAVSFAGMASPGGAGGFNGPFGSASLLPPAARPDQDHAAELTAGYYNTPERDGYAALCALCARHGAAATLTCVEMCDAQHPPEALCGPEGVLRQVREAAAAHGVPLAGENALPCFMPASVDEAALARILPPLRGCTFLRLTRELMAPSYQEHWVRFMAQMKVNESARPSGDSVPLHTLLVTPVAASPSDPVVLVRWGGGPTALVAAATASELVVVSLAGTLGIGPWESHAGTRTGKVVARRPLPSPLSGCSWTARVDGLFVCLADGTLSMLRLDWPARRLTEHWTIRPPEAQGTLAAGQSPAAPAASAAAPACRDPAVSVWWPPAESGAQGSGARREKLRHPCPVLGLAWSRRLDSFFCMAMVIQGPAQGFYPGSLRAAWAEEEPEGPPGMEPAGTAPHISTLTRVHVVRALQAVVVSSWRAEEGPSSAGPGAVTSAQAVLWGQLEQRRPRGAHHMDSPPSLTCRLEAREGSSTILVRIDCSRFATVPAAVQEPGTFFRPRPTPRTAGLPPALTLLSAWRGAATGHATPVIDIAGSPYGGQLGSLDSGGPASDGDTRSRPLRRRWRTQDAALALATTGDLVVVGGTGDALVEALPPGTRAVALHAIAVAGGDRGAALLLLETAAQDRAGPRLAWTLRWGKERSLTGCAEGAWGGAEHVRVLGAGLDLLLSAERGALRAWRAVERDGESGAELVPAGLYALPDEATVLVAAAGACGLVAALTGGPALADSTPLADASAGKKAADPPTLLLHVWRGRHAAVQTLPPLARDGVTTAASLAWVPHAVAPALAVVLGADALLYCQQPGGRTIAARHGPLPAHGATTLAALLACGAPGVAVHLLIARAAALEGGAPGGEAEAALQRALAALWAAWSVALRLPALLAGLREATATHVHGWERERNDPDLPDPERVTAAICRLGSNGGGALARVLAASDSAGHARLDPAGRAFLDLARAAGHHGMPQGGLAASLQLHSGLGLEAVVWALMSGTQEVLLEEALPSLAAAVDGSTAASESGPSAAPSFLGTRADAGHAQPPTWEALRAAGAGFWLRDPGLVLDVGEKLAKAQFAAARKPDACALLYVALGKKATLQGLYRTTNARKQADFLGRDFGLPANAQSAAKNAFVLLGQHRFSLAAAFFLLGGHVSDALDVCVRELSDLQLALFIRRIVVLVMGGKGGGVDHASGPNAPAAPHHLEDWGWGAAARAALLGDDAGLLCALCWRVRWERGGALAAAQLPALAAALLPHIVGVEAAVYDVKRERDGDAIDDADHATLLAQQLRGALTAAATSLDAARLPLLALGSAAAAIAIGPAAKEGEETGLSKTLDPLTPFLARLAASALEMAFAPEALPERLGSERDSSCSTLGLGALSRVSSSSRGGGEGTAAAAWELKRQPIVCVDGDRCGALALCSLTSPDELGGRALVVSTHRHGLVASDVIPLESAAHRGAAEAGSRPETPVSTPDVGGFQAPAAQGGIFSRIISHIFDQASWEESEKWGSSTMAESDLGFGGFVGGPTSPHTPPARGHIDGLPELGSMHASALCAHPTRQFFLSADGHGFVHLWQFGEREALASFTPLPPPDLASWGSGSLLSMGSRLFSGSLTSQLGGWGCCQDLAWSPAADAFAAVGEGGVVATWRLGRPKGVDADGHACAEWWHQCLARKGRAVTYIDEAVLAVGGEDASGNLVLWDSRACSAVARLHPTTPGDGVTRLLGPSSGLWSLAAGTVGGAVVALDLRRLSGAAAQPAAVGAGAPPALLWQAAHKKAGAVTALTRLAGGWVAAGYADGDLRMFDPGLPSAPLVLREERAHGARSRRRAAVSGLAGCPEGLVSAGADGAVFLWTLERSPEGQSSDYN
ncbi:Beta-amylase 1, chloroplastic [Auxenochlorella protothecoides]|uniref:Beta-amylase n=1 Tax=Auxenochlorella protothecoides TaxID=3075 RepID=A0A087SCW7_AUXPR|nr:Beta-amylase 1, chloroplastic [Auxenochlorella protothecoides]KFM23571.1 Beta-amylase 1, chloroplastic [Auxenochlorella protothecoides]